MAKEEITRMQIKRIEKEIRDTPYHKATEHHIGRLRARLSKLKADLDFKQSKKSGGGGGYAVKKQGDATVVLVGPPSVGKSTLINKLTNAKSKIAPYAFTTLTVIPGMMNYKDAKIQILDVPGIIGGAERGKGRGKEVLSVARSADLIIIMTDVEKLDQIEKIKKSLYENGIRLNTNPPEVIVEKKLRGNVVVHSNIRSEVSNETVKEVAKEFGYKNVEITIKESLNMDTLIDAFATNRAYAPSIDIVNKVDMLSSVERLKAKIAKTTSTPNEEVTLISAEDNLGLEELRDKIWDNLNFVRIYLVKRDESPTYDNPIVVKGGFTLDQVAKEISSEFAEDKKQAKIWGNGAKFPGQIVSLNTTVKEAMQVRFI